jgi:hypothetical protein
LHELCKAGMDGWTDDGSGVYESGYGGIFRFETRDGGGGTDGKVFDVLDFGELGVAGAGVDAGEEGRECGVVDVRVAVEDGESEAG